MTKPEFVSVIREACGWWRRKPEAVKDTIAELAKRFGHLDVKILATALKEIKDGGELYFPSGPVVGAKVAVVLNRFAKVKKQPHAREEPMTSIEMRALAARIRAEAAELQPTYRAMMERRATALEESAATVDAGGTPEKPIEGMRAAIADLEQAAKEIPE